jgi:hypothetical protein
LKIAFENASEEKSADNKEKNNKGNLLEIVREKVQVRGQKTDLRKAIINGYSKLAESLIDDQPHF